MVPLAHPEAASPHSRQTGLNRNIAYKAPMPTARVTPGPRCREVVRQEREHDFRVYKEVMFDEMAEPDLGTEEERYRVCTPYPFELNMTGADALLDFELHIDTFKNFVYYSPSAPRATPATCPANI